jgi:hypothetical protein
MAIIVPGLIGLVGAAALAVALIPTCARANAPSISATLYPSHTHITTAQQPHVGWQCGISSGKSGQLPTGYSQWRCP